MMRYQFDIELRPAARVDQCDRTAVRGSPLVTWGTTAALSNCYHWSITWHQTPPMLIATPLHRPAQFAHYSVASAFISRVMCNTPYHSHNTNNQSMSLIPKPLVSLICRGVEAEEQWMRGARWITGAASVSSGGIDVWQLR